jgi:hypothetical protein
MRLLDAASKKLHSFGDYELPEYAILSHTWHDEEILFEDLPDISWDSQKAGFAKVLHCCDQVLRDGLKYIWIDTCCIDKTSSTELSEAINSMYRWYQNAKVCYVYLRDVPNDFTNLQISSSRWFRRAWTLQELLAPRNLIFYSNEWVNIGTRTNLKSVISEVTGIEEEYLIHRQLQRASIAKRMSWAANREATRSEDIAYSLFGIFDIQMPLLYGEGQQKAFLRLQEEIMKTSNDHTILAWTVSSLAAGHPETCDTTPQIGDRVDGQNETSTNVSFTC